MINISRHAGSTSNIIPIFVRDAGRVDGSGLTGLHHNTSGLSCHYKRDTASSGIAVTLVDIPTLGTFAPGGFKSVDDANLPGIYEFHPPDGAFAVGANAVLFLIRGGSSMAPILIEVELTAVSDDPVAVTLGTHAPAGWIDAAAIADGALHASVFAADTAYDGIAAAVTENSITLDPANRPAVDISSSMVTIWSATVGAGQSRPILSYDPATGKAVVPAWDPIPTGSVAYRREPPVSAMDLFAPMATGFTTGTPTTTVIPAKGYELSDVEDAYKDQFLVPAAGRLKGTGQLITAYAAASKTFTTTAFPVALASDVRFAVLGKKGA